MLDESSLKHLQESKRVGLKWKGTSEDPIPLEMTRYVLNRQGIDVIAARKESPDLGALLVMDSWSSANRSIFGTREFSESFETLSRRQKAQQDNPPKVTYKTSLTVKIEGHKVYKREFKSKRVWEKEASGSTRQELLVYCLMDVIAQVNGMSAVLGYLESDSTPVWRGACEYLAEDESVFRAPADSVSLIRSASLSLFESPVADRRVLAAKILAKFGDPDAVARLVSGLADTEFEVRRACREALKKITSHDFGYDIGQWSIWLEANKRLSSEPR